MDTSTTAPPSVSENIESHGSYNFAHDSVNFAEWMENLLYLINVMWSQVTLHKIVAVLSLIFFFLKDLVEILFKVIKWLGEFTIRFMQEFTKFVKAVMPLLLALVELVQKTIGGFYLLLAMMWQSWKTGGQHRPVRGVEPPIQGYIEPNYVYRQYNGAGRADYRRHQFKPSQYRF